MAEVQSVGRQFFEAQDRTRGGPDEALCAIDYTADLNGMQFDLDGHRQFTAGLYAGFPNLRHVIESVQVGEAAERVRLRLLGTHEGEFLGIAPTGKQIDIAADVILMLRDGKVESLIGSFDQAGMMQQLGVG